MMCLSFQIKRHAARHAIPRLSVRDAVRDINHTLGLIRQLVTSSKEARCVSGSVSAEHASLVCIIWCYSACCTRAK